MKNQRNNYRRKQIIVVVVAYIIYAVVFTILWTIAGNSYSMRCGNDLVNEGDSVYKVTQDCGQPQAVTGGSILSGSDGNYIYKQDDGMTYSISVSNGTVQSIDYSR